MNRITVPPSRIVLFILLVAGGCALDLATKSWVFAKLGMPYDSPPIVLIPGVFSITTSLNEGALFGLGQGMTSVFAALSIIAAAGILYWLFYVGAGRDLWLLVSLAAIMAGIFGNLYDRLGFPGLVWSARFPNAGEPVRAVRDWLHFEIQKVHFDWPVFNIADSLLVTGAIMLFVHVAWREGRQRAVSNSPSDATQTGVS